ncbi:hypothetical protein ILUMI_26419 [Ignelater luminosus]|uniref:Peptidase S1 domain-containing protein n=1 Tax=Ignelater luminosus TaxID=2038154 RepID=A0A8K0C5T7_IGNLU|nr:hypothetical protein ILUMI_26419 [Ignelater luminosus]
MRRRVFENFGQCTKEGTLNQSSENNAKFGTIRIQYQTSAASLGGIDSISSSFDSRIIGGSNAERRQFPYMISLHSKGNHGCGASILSHTWVITAAHCLVTNFGLKYAAIQVIAGLFHQHESHPDVQKSSVTKVVIHPNYFYNYTKFLLILFKAVTSTIKISFVFLAMLDNDIALLKLASPLIFTNAVQPVKLPSTHQAFTKGWLSGWGIYQRPPALPVTLQYAIVCAMPPTEGSETACNGDSGGPIDDDGVLIGITSWVVTCPIYKKNAPIVFTAVNKYSDFNNEHVDDLPL